MYNSEMWQTIFLGAFLLANAIISAAHRERIAKKTKMPPMVFDVSISIDPTGERDPVVIVRKGADAD